MSSSPKTTTIRYLIFLARLALAIVWLYNGLWLKVIATDAHHLAIVTALGIEPYISPLFILKAIGCCETLLAAGILSGLLFRFVSYFQIFILLLMNTLGIMFGSGTIQNPAGLIVSNLPTLICCLFIAHLGPGAFAMSLPSFSRQADNSSEQWH